MTRHERSKNNIVTLKTRGKNGENAFLSRVNLRAQVQVRPIDKLDEARTNADDQMMLVQHYSADRVMSYRGFDRIS